MMREPKRIGRLCFDINNALKVWPLFVCGFAQHVSMSFEASEESRSRWCNQRSYTAAFLPLSFDALIDGADVIFVNRGNFDKRPFALK